MLGVLVGSGWPGISLAGQQFSADLVASGAAQTTGKIYVSNNKVRIETPDFPEGLFLSDGNAHTAYFVKPAQRVVMDAKQSTGPLKYSSRSTPATPASSGREWRTSPMPRTGADDGCVTGWASKALVKAK